MATLAELRSTLTAAGVPAQLLPDRAGELVVEELTHDSRRIEHERTMFACLRGDAVDGHDFAGAAVAAGAVALLAERAPEGAEDVPRLLVPDTRRALGDVAAEVYGHPSRALRTVGITGTNGKTTTAQMLAAILDAAGWRPGVVGTLHGVRTTPEATDLQRRLAQFVQQGHESAVLEVSSHALALHRVDGTEFDVVVFTNLGHDHLDLHGSQEEYFRAKASLFDPRVAPVAVVNTDDPHGLLLADTIESSGGTAADAADRPAMRVVRVGRADAERVVVGARHLSFRWRGVDVEVAIGGRFNVDNALAALTAAVELGLDPAEAAVGLTRLPRVPGRFEVVTTESGRPAPTVIVDYAHTPDGLRELLQTARPLAGDHRLVVVFGCGGERDRAKRPEMGEVAVSLADLVVATSDNPRHEDPERILDDILDGVDARYRARVIRNADRRAAIGDALTTADPGDVVVIAGKGHERTQDLGSEIVEFDDRSVALELLEDLP